MKAARIVEPGRIAVEDVPLPEPGPGQVRLKVGGCGVCGSNLGPWKGLPWMSYPRGPGEGGHEAWGTVDALGPGVDGVEEGTVAAALCERGWAEYDLADAASLVPLPEGVRGFPAEPVACAVNVFRRSGIQPGEDVAIVGVGFLGAIVARLASSVGARVIGISRRDFALGLARGMGAAETVRMDDHHRVIEEVRRLTRGRLCDRVVEATGHPWPLDLSAELTRERGTLVIAGYHQDGPRQVDVQLWNWRGLDVVNAHERDPAVYVQGMRAAVNLVGSGQLDMEALVTHVLPLDALDEALNATAERPDGFLKAVVAP